MGFTGPSINVQTACSTSLVAVAQACQALVNQHCDIGVAGGVAVTFPQQPSYRSQEDGIHSRDGHCRAFDASATGTVFGDGVGVVVLKRLDDALARRRPHRGGDSRLGRSTTTAQTKRVLLAPSVNGQARGHRSEPRIIAKVRPQSKSVTSRRTAPARRSAIR